MYAVAKVGSLISQGVYSVATPFHPFGGAVDIIVVQQQDGSFRSTPWYVRFGKFQGVLKGAEKFVRINVNGVEANFRMYLDNSGEAYFVREVDSNNACDTQIGKDGVQGDGIIYNDCAENFPAHRLQSTLSDPGLVRDDFSSFRPNRLDRAESDACNFYDFQDDPSSLDSSVELSSYGSSRYDNLDGIDNVAEAQGPGSEMVLVSVDGHILTAPISSTEQQNTDDVELDTPQFHLGPGESTEFCEEDTGEWDAGYLTNLNAASSSKVKAVNNSGDENNNAMEDELEVSNDKADACQKQGNGDAHNAEKCEEVGESRHRDQSPKNEQHDVVITEEAGECIDQKKVNTSYENQDRDLHMGSDGEEESVGHKTFDRFQSCLKSADIDELSDHEVQVGESLSDIREDSESPYESPPKGVSNDTGARISRSRKSADDDEELKFDESSLNEETGSSTCDHPLISDVDTENHAEEENDQCAGIPNPERVSVGDISCSKDDQTNVAQADRVMQNSSDILSVEGESCASEIVRQKADTGAEGQVSSGSSFEISLCGHLLRHGMGSRAAAEAFDAHRISKEEFKACASSIIKNEKLIVRVREEYLPWDKAAPIVLGAAAFDLYLPVEPRDVIPVLQEEKVDETESRSASTSGRKWRLWPIPFRRVKTLEHSNSDSSNEEIFVDPETPSQERLGDRTPTSQKGTPSSDVGSKSPHKKVVRTNIPTSEQIASLNLKDGQNIVTFSFFTRVLGLQEIEAHIYLWKWDTKIVISDVDGTITKSDVLGQFMPLVGRDWSQSGVARLFSAIKENGYQLLFLSARAIVQAYLTKSFLFNLKQDGKTLPNGPVVISPDGLFPSLYREVIRRAPHEFKIACLEDIKALFPSDYNPFYAGFGNRDTDELSYRKIGIPKGKIFIINPKGEVAINNRIDVRSYTNLHTLVNDMFPPTSLVEQEDYNAWNYWRMPLPVVED